MSDEQKSALDLDAIYGKSKTLTVTWDGKAYRFKHMQEFGPREVMEIFQLRERAARAAGVRKASAKDVTRQTLTTEQSKELEQLTDQLLLTFCPEFPVKKIPFLARFRTLQWYYDQMALDVEKKMTRQARTRVRTRR